MSSGRCDFCASAEVAWSYPAEPLLLDRIARSTGSWRACPDCAALIEAGDREALARRSLRTIPAGRVFADGLGPAARALRARIHRLIRAIHDEFFEARRGPARPVFKR